MIENLFVAASLMAGAVLAVQAGANAQLSKAIGSPFGATVIQLGVGAALLSLVAILAGEFGALAGLGGVPLWHALGGTASAFYVVSTILLWPRLGAVVSVGLFITGQIMASLMLDHFGLLGVATSPLDLPALAGALVILTGAAVIVRSQRDASVSRRGASSGWILLALAAGAVLPLQGAVNALLRADLGAPLAVGAMSFVVATASMGIVVFLVAAIRRVPTFGDGDMAALPWWGWVGGIAGAIYVTTVFTGMSVIGASAVTGFTIAGQQVASVLVDHFGWFRLPKRPVSALHVAGIAALLAGVAITKS